jgi:hypothetical protein
VPTFFLDNPAGRLLKVLTDADARRSNNSALGQWAQVFEVEQSPADQLMARSAELMALIIKVRQLIEAFPDEETPELSFGTTWTSRAWPTISSASAR